MSEVPRSHGALAAVVLGFGASALEAQATGKIEGVVRDQNEQPVPNARIVLVGTAFSAVANPQGYWFINGVPAGTYDVRTSFVGYRPQEIRGVRVISGQTITQDIQLEQTAVEIQEISVVAAENALVPRDQVTSKQIIDGAFADKLPADNIVNILAMQPGVTANSNLSSFQVRGSRTDEVNMYVDGVPITPMNRSTGAGRDVPTLEVGINTFEDASVTTGAASAEFGNAQGGVVAITTRTGGQRFSGNLGFESDELSGNTMGSGYNRLQASFGGPLVGDLTFFVGGALTGSRFGNRGFHTDEIPSWVRVGVDTVYRVPKTNSQTADSLTIPMHKMALFGGDCDAYYAGGSSNPDIANNYGYECHGNLGAGGGSNSNLQLTSKLNWSFGQGSRISVSYLTSRDLNRGGTGIHGTAATYDRAQVFTANWNQVLSKSSSNALALDAYFSYQTNNALQSLLTTESEVNTRDPFLGWYFTPFDFEYDSDDFPVTDELIRNYQLQSAGSRMTLFDRTNPAQYAQTSGYSAPPGTPGGVSSWGDARDQLEASNESRWIGKANIDWQVDRYNRLKTGVEYISSQMDLYNLNTESLSFSDMWAAEPVRYSVFAEDRLDLGDVVLVGGLRYDAFDIGANKWKDFPRLSSWPGITPETLDERLEPYTKHDYISPHIQVAFPVTDRTNFRLSYAQQVQTPDFAVALFGSNTDLSITNTNQNYGNDLDFGKTVLFEFGVRHSFSDDMVLDVAVYNKDNLANAAGRLLSLVDPRSGENVNIRQTVNADFGNTRGIDVALDRRFGNIFNGRLTYAYQDARNTGSDPYTYINFGTRITSAVTGGAVAPPQAAQPVGYSRPHQINALLNFSFPSDFAEGTVLGAVLGNMTITGTGRYASGTPYTRCNPDYDGDLGVTSGNPCDALASDFNGARRPSIKDFNVRVTKGFSLGGLDLTAYADARNVFNFKNILNVFAATGAVTNTRLQEQMWTADSTTFAQFARPNNAYDNASGNITLAPSNAACGSWIDSGNRPIAPTCYLMRKSEERYGNGDGVMTLAEQRRASDIDNIGTFHISRFAGQGRMIRLGMEVNF
ncbi:MAG TPA: TonB-dependent receptor [Gemmatimonadales bacterium]|nr:TonB-dependent receptor [Gemmatimonadales bacterium]